MERKINYVFLNGKRAKLSSRELFQLSVHREIFLYYVGSFTYMNFFHLYSFLDDLSPNLFGLSLLAIVLITVLIFLGICVLGDKIQHADKFNPTIYISIPLALANILTGLIVYRAADWALGIRLELFDLIVLIVYNMAIAEVILLLYANFGLDRALESLGLLENSEKQAAMYNSVNVFGKPFDPHKIRFIKSDDAYVEVYTTTDRLHMRGKITDAVEVLQKFGFSPHRSYWCAFRFIDKIEGSSNKGYQIQMSGGGTIPVAKMKNYLIEELLRKG